MSLRQQAAARPRILTHGLTDDENATVRLIAGSVRSIENPLDAYPEEHDLLVAADADLNAFGGFFQRRLSFAPRADDWKRTPQPARYPTGIFDDDEHGVGPSRIQSKPAQVTVATDFARDLGIAALVERTCLPAPHERYVGLPPNVWIGDPPGPLAQELLRAPLTLAALVENGVEDLTRQSLFWLPHSARAELAAWLRVAIAHWRPQDPEAFPESANWATTATWASPAELRSMKARADFEESESLRLMEASAERARLKDSLEAARDEGRAWRSLLQETGDDLVDSVLGSLEFLGFQVTNADELPQHRGRKREDLRVQDGDWVCLVEVKGYTGAAKSNDLMQLSSAHAAFAASTGAEADSLWYVPNSFRRDDPQQREVALVGREEDVASFGTDMSGCVIETRELFALRQMVATGQIAATEARACLKRARGRFVAANVAKGS